MAVSVALLRFKWRYGGLSGIIAASIALCRFQWRYGLVVKLVAVK